MVVAEDARILVVDDDRVLADTLVDYLSELGYQAVAAYGGIDGLERFKSGVFQDGHCRFKNARHGRHRADGGG